MKKIVYRSKIDHKVDIIEEFEMHGMFEEDVYVKKGGKLILHGMASKNVIVEPGGSVKVTGIVSGDLVDLGGKIELTGLVVGRMLDNNYKEIIKTPSNIRMSI